MKKLFNFLASIFNFLLSAYGLAEQKNYILKATAMPLPISAVMPPTAMPLPTPTVMPSTGAKPSTTSTGSAGGAGSGGGGGGSAPAPSGERTGTTAPATDPLRSAIITGGFGVIGLLAGLGFAYYRKSKPVGYAGWGLLGAVALSGIATGFYMAKGTNIFKGTATPPVPTPPPAPTA